MRGNLRGLSAGPNSRWPGSFVTELGRQNSEVVRNLKQDGRKMDQIGFGDKFEK